jgi:type II secretory pathway component PulF
MQIQESLQRGVSFGNALEEFPEFFSNLYISMVKAGESSGTLNVVLSRLADYFQKRKKIMSGLVAAMVYPLFVMCVGIIVVILLMTFVVPELLDLITKGTGKAVLPFPTRILIAVSSLFTTYWWVLLVVAVVGSGILYYILIQERGRYLFDRLLLNIPVLGTLFQKTAVSRFATTFSTLLKSGIPPLDSLLIVQEVLNNKYLEEAISQVRRGVMDGNDMSVELDKTEVFPPIVGHMVSVGEESGELESLLEDIAEAYDTEVALATEKLIAVLEPTMIVIMAVVIGFIVFAIILPIMEIGNII